jgi:hypothetical protein
MSKLIMGAAYGYKTKLLEPFIKSLRRNWDGDCLLVVHPLSDEEHKFYEKYNIATFELEDEIKNPKDIQVMRYDIYKGILEDNFLDVKQILISDIRDVMFQDDPFRGSNGAELEFFLEPCLFKDCTANWPWVGGIYGREGMDVVAAQRIVCSGTTMGTRAGVLRYINTMITEINRIRDTGRPLYQGEDQPIHNYLIYTDHFHGSVFHNNGEGPITTVHHQQQLTFDRQGRLLNLDGTPTPVIHQWDRADACKSVLERTALEGPL